MYAQNQEHLSVSPSQTTQRESEPPLGVEDSIDEPYESEHHQRCFNEGSINYEAESIEASVYASADYDPNQLTLSFRGQVYVFDSVSTDKGGCLLE